MTPDLARLIASGSSDDLQECLERCANRWDVDLKERLLYGVLLHFPPFAEPEAAKQVFATLLESPLQFNAAVWDAFRYATLMADEDKAFEPVLMERSHSAVASHMLSRVALAEGRMPTFHRLMRSGYFLGSRDDKGTRPASLRAFSLLRLAWRREECPLADGNVRPARTLVRAFAQGADCEPGSPFSCFPT